jgi:uncharacterized protein YjbI with pentapeptide repeats
MHADFKGAALESCDFTGAQFKEASLEGVTIKDGQHLAFH